MSPAVADWNLTFTAASDVNQPDRIRIFLFATAETSVVSPEAVAVALANFGVRTTSLTSSQIAPVTGSA